VPKFGFGTGTGLFDTLQATAEGFLDFHRAYCDEAYAMLAPDWFDETGRDPQGLDLKTLTDDLRFVTSQ
jgi:hypothetical protein